MAQVCKTTNARCMLEESGCNPGAIPLAFSGSYRVQSRVTGRVSLALPSLYLPSWLLLSETG